MNQVKDPQFWRRLAAEQRQFAASAERIALALESGVIGDLKSHAFAFLQQAVEIGKILTPTLLLELGTWLLSLTKESERV